MNVLIVDDDALVCTSLKMILESDPEIHVVGIGHDGTEAITLYDELSPDVVLMDIRMKEMTGTDAAVTILSRHSDARILFLTTFSDDEYIYSALSCGAKGYLLKSEFESIIPSVKAVYLGQMILGSDVAGKLPHVITPEHDGFDGARFGLSEKESEIVTLVAQGLSNKEIAEQLFLSEGTVRNYLSTILEKLSLRDRTQLAIFYYKN